MRYTSKVSVWLVGNTGGLRYEGPLCSNGTVTGWHAVFARDRIYQLDMAGFAVGLPLLVHRKMAIFEPSSKVGHIEGSLIEHLINGISELEPKANCSKVSPRIHMCCYSSNDLNVMLQMCTYVTEFWKITLVGTSEIIRIFEFTTILLTSQNTF